MPYPKKRRAPLPPSLSLDSDPHSYDPRARHRHSRPVHLPPARRTETPTPWPPLARTARLPITPQPPPACPPLPAVPRPPPAHRASASIRALRPPPPWPLCLGLRPDCQTPDFDTPAGTSSLDFASATTHPSSGILNTKRAPTLAPQPPPSCCAPATTTSTAVLQLVPVLRPSLRPPLAHPPASSTPSMP
jgi:hypothetical protein